MYEKFYGLDEKPFMLTPDPRYLYLSHSHRDALNHLRYGIREGEGFIVVAGQVGVGKTTICRALLEHVPHEVRVAMVVNPLVSEVELMETILEEFEITPKHPGRIGQRTIKECHDLLNVFLHDLAARGGRGVLIVDEAQNLSLSTLERIRLLSNIEMETVKLLQIILVGQMELLKKLSIPELAQLNQRISVRYALTPLTQRELNGYIGHRLKVAGAKVPIIFSPDTIPTIYKYSGGLPRLINLACDRALLAGFEEESTVITHHMVVRGIKSLEGTESNMETHVPPSNRRLLVLLGSLLAVAVGAAVVFFIPMDQLLRLSSQSSTADVAPPLQPTAAVDTKPPEPTTSLDTTAPKAASAAGTPDPSKKAPETLTSPTAPPTHEMPRFFIALEVFGEQMQDKAKDRIAQLQSQGYQSHLGKILTSDNKVRYGIFISGLGSRKDMETTLDQLRSIDSFAKAQIISME